MASPRPPTGPPAYQDIIKERLMANQEEGEQYREIIDQYRRLARTAREFKIRNKALLRSGAGPSAGSDGLVTHLESQLTLLRNELSNLYRTQAAAQNKQLQLSDSLRDRDEEVRGLREEIRVLREQRDAVGRKEEEWEGRWRARGRDVETLNDELLSLNLELTSLQQRNAALQADNAQLLQRWLDRMQESVDGMNDEFERETASTTASNTPVVAETGATAQGAPKAGTPAVPPAASRARPASSPRPPAPASTSSATGGAGARTASGGKVDERRKMFETKTNHTAKEVGGGGAGAGAGGFRIGGKAK